MGKSAPYIYEGLLADMLSASRKTLSFSLSLYSLTLASFLPYFSFSLRTYELFSYCVRGWYIMIRHVYVRLTNEPETDCDDPIGPPQRRWLTRRIALGPMVHVASIPVVLTVEADRIQVLTISGAAIRDKKAPLTTSLGDLT
jgi:hypothetical protein